MTEQTGAKLFREYKTIADDEVAVSNCKQIRLMRFSDRLSQKEFGARYGISGSCIGTIERNPENVTVLVYNALALGLGWPAYQSGRKLPPMSEAQPPMHNPKQTEEKRETLTFMDELFSVSPAEGFDAWFDSLDAKVKSHVNSLSDLLSISPSELAFYALREFTSKREALL